MSKRNPQIEILRLIAMYMILMLHSNGHGGTLNYEFGSVGYMLFWFLESVCIVGVNVFVLISGYFGTKSTFKMSRVVSFYIEVVLFSIICTAIAALLSDNVGLMEWVYAFFPLSSKRYWFASVYALLLFAQPLLNRLLNNMDKKTHGRCIVVSFIIFSLVPTFLIWNREIVGTGMDIVWFMILYLVGAYINKYGVEKKNKHWMSFYIVLTLFLFISDVVIPYGVRFITGNISGVGIFYYYNTVFVFLASICFFMFFVEHDFTNNAKRIKGLIGYLSKIGSYVFGAYLISDHRVIRSILWQKVNLTGVSDNIIVVLLYMLLINLIILGIGILLDFLIKTVVSSKPVKHILQSIDQLIGRHVFFNK